MKFSIPQELLVRDFMNERVRPGGRVSSRALHSALLRWVAADRRRVVRADYISIKRLALILRSGSPPLVAHKCSIMVYDGISLLPEVDPDILG